MTLKTEHVWMPKPGIIKSVFPGVDWNDIQALMNDGRFGSMVAVPVYGTADSEVKEWLADGEVTEAEMSGSALPVVAGIGILALLLI